MKRFTWCGLTLASDLDLPELGRGRVGRGGRPAWRLRLRGNRRRRYAHTRWFHHWRFPDGRQWLSFGRHQGGYVLRFPSLAQFDVLTRERQIVGSRARGTPLHTFRHLLLDQVLPLVVGDRDSLALHASVVAVDGRAVAFLGGTGSGKSTLAAALAKQGCALLSDDCCVLRRSRNRFRVQPSYPGVRLFPESIEPLLADVETPFEPVSHYSSKRRVAGSEVGVRFCRRAMPLGRLYHLTPITRPARTTEVCVRARSARESVLDLVAATFYLDVGDTDRMRTAFDLAGDIASAHGVRRLSFPWNLAQVDRVTRAILRDRPL